MKPVAAIFEALNVIWEEPTKQTQGVPRGETPTPKLERDIECNILESFWMIPFSGVT